MSISFFAGRREADITSSVFTSEETVERFYKSWDDDEGTANPGYRPELDINLSNRNARYVLAQLGITMDDDFFEVTVDQMVNLCTHLLRRSLKGQRSGIESSVDRQAGHATMIDCGVEQGYVERQVMRILTLCREGKARGAEVIYGA